MAAQRVGVPTLSGQNLGPQSNGFQMTTGAMPNKPDFTPYFGKPIREVKTNPYESCVLSLRPMRVVVH
jgi:hypothetical protein